jgi:hypothetical protein
LEDEKGEKDKMRRVSIARVMGSNQGYFGLGPARRKTPWNTFFKPVDVNEYVPRTAWSNNSGAFMEERLDHNMTWSINPFVHNPYEKNHHHRESGKSTPSHDFDHPDGGTMMTIQQMNVMQEMSTLGNRKKSVDAHPLSTFEQLGAPKASYAELFYDLFFVASLTSFGIKHEITQEQAIASYVAFFTVLW